MIHEDDDEGGMAGRMRPPQHKQHRKNESRYMYRSGEHLSLDPIGPFQIASPQGFDCAMVYGDKHDGDISVQGFKLAGKRSVTSLVKEEINFRELTCEKFKGLRASNSTCTWSTPRKKGTPMPARTRSRAGSA